MRVQQVCLALLCQFTLGTARGIRLIGAGLPSTGTQSFVSALRRLGYKSTHGADTFINMSLRSSWSNYAHRGGSLEPALREILDQGFDATNDAPFVFSWGDLLHNYPDALVVLTVRDSAERWYNSILTKNHHPNGVEWLMLVLVSSYWGSDYSSYPAFLAKNQAKYGCNFRIAQTPELKESCMQGYLSHVEKVKRTVPPERLLVYNVKQGWAPLCEFLGVPIPSRDFPRMEFTKNVTMSWQKVYRDLQDNVWTDSQWAMVKPTLLFFGFITIAFGFLCCLAVYCFCRCTWRCVQRMCGKRAKQE